MDSLNTQVETAIQKFNDNEAVEVIKWFENELELDLVIYGMDLQIKWDNSKTDPQFFTSFEDQAESVLQCLEFRSKSQTSTVEKIVHSAIELIEQLTEEVVDGEDEEGLTASMDGSDTEEHDDDDDNELVDSLPDSQQYVMGTSSSFQSGQLKTDFNQAVQYGLGEGFQKLVMNTLIFQLPLSNLSYDMMEAIGLVFHQPITVTLHFSASYLEDPLLPTFEIKQTDNDHFFLKTQLEYILKQRLTNFWLSMRESKPFKRIDGRSVLNENNNTCPPNDSDIAHLVSMGFSTQDSRLALRLTENKVDQAISCIIDGDLGKTLESLNNDPSNHQSPDIDFEVPFENLIYDIIVYMRYRLPTCTSYCVMCDREHEIASLRLLPCNKPECKFRFNELGLGCSLKYELEHNSEVVDLLISMACSAASSQRGDLLFDPFPTDFIQGDKKYFRGLLDCLQSVPDVGSLRDIAINNDEQTLRNEMEKTDQYSYRLVRWLVTTNRAVLKPVKNEISEMQTSHQYVLLSSTPEKEAAFKSIESKKILAFHGSPFENWHNILRNGLKNASGTKYQMHGAAMGSGIYFATNSSTSVGYSRPGNGWKNSMFGESVSCIALCEVITETNIARGGGVYVIPNEEHVMTRYFFVYKNQSIPGVDSTRLKIQHK
eukprot:gb/GECH01014883.1/.p1 GENE.gb/GECH01014883.1/~~gb/GECH01014883.1/.p1  ORF type:complete len:656 (+),score=165.10 gb/GECH01014883.1/:1-1968(+)